MVSRNTSRRLVAVLAWLVAGPLTVRGQAPTAPSLLRLSFADAVSMAAGKTPVVELATLRTTEADARVRQARAAAALAVGERSMAQSLVQLALNRDLVSRRA